MRLLGRQYIALITLVAALSGCWQTSYGVPFYELVRVGTPVAAGMIWCRITGCPAKLPDGFSEQAMDAGLLKSAPVAIDVDPEGRIYIAEAPRIYGGAEDNRQHDYWLMDDLASRTVADRQAYYEKWLATDRIEDKDRFSRNRDVIVQLEDTDGDGVVDARRELAHFGEMVDGPAAGVLADGTDVFATVIPHVWRLSPSEDGASWQKESLAEGFGVKTSLLGHDLHGLVRGPDGKLYFTVGDRGYSVTNQEGELLEPAMGPGRGAVFRMNLDGSELEVFATGVRNPQELAFDDHGNLFTGDNNGDGGDAARIVYLVEGGETGWAMPFQTLVGDYVRGPWVEERLWELQHPTQPAWVLPPVAHLTNGPSGFAHYPGTGLPKRYAGHFFLCDYAYSRTRSGIHSFALEPQGAGFEMVDDHVFVGSILPTDVVFGYDGRIYTTDFSQFTNEQTLRVIRYEDGAEDPLLAETERLAREGMAERNSGELVALLGHADQRIRLRAQYQLADRRDAALLGAVAAADDAPLLARIHAVWGLGQLGDEALRTAGWTHLRWTLGDESVRELRAQVIKIVGDTKADWLAADLIEALGDSDEGERVRFFAAQSLGALGSHDAIDPLFALLVENADQDVFLRHAAVHALSRIGDLDAVFARAGDPNRSARLAALLVLRRADDARILRFLSDEDPALVVEAARAIYDRPIADAMPALARLAGTELPFRNEEPQSNYALQRRVIGAALAVGDAESATALAAHAADTGNPLPMRELALETLGAFTAPGPRDLTQGFYRPLAERPREVVTPAFDTWGRRLVKSDLGARALDVALAYQHVPLGTGELAEYVRSSDQPTAVRIASLRALAIRGGARDRLDQAIEDALDSEEPALRAQARSELTRLDPEAALVSLAAIADDAPASERQAAYRTLASMETPEATARLADAVGQLEAGTLPTEVQLDVIAAAKGRPALTERITAWEAQLPNDPVAQRSWALAGGDPEKGRLVFDGAGDCRRCHGASAGHGASVGPDLASLGSRASELEMLRSVVDPQAEVVPGYGSISLTTHLGQNVTGTLLEENLSEVIVEASGEPVRVLQTQIVTRTRVASPMPPIAQVLAPADLRDLMAYLGTL